MPAHFRAPLAFAQRLARQRRLAARRVYAVTAAECCTTLAITGDAADDARDDASVGGSADATGASASSGSRDSGPDRGSRPVILLAEDEVAVLRMLVRYLEDADYLVLAATNGVEALEIAAGYPHAIDLVITDVSMPQMNGRMLADRLGELRPGVPVIFMSGYTGDIALDRGPGDAKHLFVAKPFSLAVLEDMIREQLDRTRGSGA